MAKDATVTPEKGTQDTTEEVVEQFTAEQLKLAAEANRIINDNPRGTKYKVPTARVLEAQVALDGNVEAYVAGLSKDQIRKYGSGEERIPKELQTRIRAQLTEDAPQMLWPRALFAVAAAMKLTGRHS